MPSIVRPVAALGRRLLPAALRRALASVPSFAPSLALTSTPAAALRFALWFALWFTLLALAGCAGLPPAQAPASQAIVAAADSPLGRLALDAGVPAGRSGFRPLLLSAIALQTRLALIDGATASLDLQTYQLGDDATGHQILRALRGAAQRGVRVRLLVDDLYTTGLTDLLLGLAAEPGVELRLYNPFPAGRDSTLLRLASLLGDFQRLNRRMHNKLFIADGRVAIVGGRNLADAYFMRSDEGNYLDFDLLGAGRVAADLGGHFDRFWNSRFALPVQALADNGLDPAQRRASFERLSLRDLRTDRRAAPLQAAIAALAAQPLVVADARVFFDSPDKTAGSGADALLPISALLDGATERVVIVSPYFLPSAAGLQRMRAARDRGVTVQVITNSLLDSDEPLVSLAYGQRRQTLLRAGVQLFELSSARLKQEDMLRLALGASIGRLHAKLGFIDDHLLLVGSMNLDPRSASTNTELALAIDSAELSRVVLGQFQPTAAGGVFEVQLAADGEALEWIARRSAGEVEQRLDSEPAPPWWQRLRLWLLSRLVSDDLL